MNAAMVETLMLLQPVAPGAHHVDRLGLQDERLGVGEHGADEAGHLVDRLPLGPQRDDERGDLRRRGLPFEHLTHHRSRPRCPRG